MSVGDAFLGDVRAALASSLQGAFGEEVQVSAYMIGDPTPPHIYIFPDETDYDEAGSGGLHRYGLTIQAFIVAGLMEAEQMKLDRMISPKGDLSVKEAAESDPTLGGVVSDLHVTTCTGYQQYRVNGKDYLGAQWAVEVFAPDPD